MMNPAFSIIMPVYNSEKWLSDSIGSILAQSYQYWEFICINDGSEDGSLHVLRQYAEQDKRIKIIDQPNAGASAARNAGLEAAKGDYIMFLDSDDFFDANALEILSNAIELTSADMLFVRHREVENSCHFSHHTEQGNEAILSNCSIKDILSHAPDYPTDKIYKADIILSNNLRFDPLITLTEDFHFWYRFAMLSDNIIKLDNNLYNHRHNPGSLSHRYYLRWQNCPSAELERNLCFFQELANLCANIADSAKRYTMRRELLMRAVKHYITTKKKLIVKLRGRRRREALKMFRFPLYDLTREMSVCDISTAVVVAFNSAYNMVLASLRFHLGRKVRRSD